MSKLKEINSYYLKIPPLRNGNIISYPIPFAHELICAKAPTETMQSIITINSADIL